MTKGECVLMDCGFNRVPNEDMTEKKHDGSNYAIRVYRAEMNGNIYRALCESYYGSTKLYRDGKYMGDFEYVYEDIPRVLGIKS